MTADLNDLRTKFEKAKAHFDFWTSGKRCEPGSQTWAEATAGYESARDAYQFALAQSQNYRTKLDPDPSRLDSLLGIYNQNAYIEDYAQLVAKATPSDCFSLLAIDVDDFKEANDKYGHDVGDSVLKCVATVLRRGCERKGDCYRKGGDELVALLYNHSAQETRALAERIRVELSQCLIDSQCPSVTLSMGIASYPEITDNAENLFKKADEALYSAKHAGKDNVCIADGSQAGQTMPRLAHRIKAREGKGLPRTEMSVQLIQCINSHMLIEIHNESESEILIKRVGLWSDGIRLMQPWRPDANLEWRIRPEARLPINRPTSSNPAGELIRMNSNKGIRFMADVEFHVRCEASGTEEDVTCKLRVQVSATPPCLVQLAGS